ncbi:alpha/beta hydrolase [Sphingomonas sp.]|uniref:alpha/beta hydrolase n=1 Tax=Sphingomonas sp. TaxID=28214 RepID=UPI002BC19FF1|nr:alpha/beta hydrolase [Sphingomonas sp.]HTG39638.1 alpha/beta hydrolase [Sphingomonas sp.]
MDRRKVLELGLGMGLGAAGLAASGIARGQTGDQRPSDLPWPPRETFDLWPGKAPGAPATLPQLVRYGPEGRELWLRGIPAPTLSVYRPTRPNGVGVLSIPGGGYGFVSVENEGHNVAKVLNALGYTVFVLVYRLPGEGWADRADVPLQDAQRAMRLIRARATSFGVDPERIGILGFSAGGHLAGSLMTRHNDSVYRAVDAADRQSARPDFAGLIYAVTALRWNGEFNNSGRNLLGAQPGAAAVARQDVTPRIDSETPPMFLLHAGDDGLVPLEMSLSLIAAARAAKRPVDAHLYDTGGHGFGMALDPAHPAHGWGALYATWVARMTGG